ncbi:hypothetical protein J3A83DRAFT_2630807 [Scleroderma citrinum]
MMSRPHCLTRYTMSSLCPRSPPVKPIHLQFLLLDSSRLQSILDTTSQLSYALTQLSALPSTSQASKLVSLMKQHAAITSSITVSRAATTSLASGDRRVTFPDTAPPSPNRLAEWGRAMGMEAFIDNSSSSSTNTVVLAGKVLVLDIDIDGRVAVKTSFAVGNNVPNNTPVAPDLDAFLSREVSRWVETAKNASTGQLSSNTEDPSVEASLCARSLQDHLRYLMTLDSLAAGEGERGIRWFMEAMTAYQYFTSSASHHPIGCVTTVTYGLSVVYPH